MKFKFDKRNEVSFLKSAKYRRSAKNIVAKPITCKFLNNEVNPVRNIIPPTVAMGMVARIKFFKSFVSSLAVLSSSFGIDLIYSKTSRLK